MKAAKLDEKSLLACQSSCPEKPNSEIVSNDVLHLLAPSRTLLTLSTTTEKLHY